MAEIGYMNVYTVLPIGGWPGSRYTNRNNQILKCLRGISNEPLNTVVSVSYNYNNQSFSLCKKYSTVPENGW